MFGVCTLTVENPLTCFSSLLSHPFSKLTQPRLEHPPKFARARTIQFRNKGMDNFVISESLTFLKISLCVLAESCLTFLVPIFPHFQYFFPLCQALILLNSDTAVSPGNKCTETLLSPPHTHTHTHTHTNPYEIYRGKSFAFNYFSRH